MARVLIVEARFYAHLNDLLLEGARAAIEEKYRTSPNVIGVVMTR